MHRHLISTLSLSLLGGSQLLAQTETRPDSALERLTVTGSRIGSFSQESPRTVIRISREELEQSGLKSLGDILNRLPQMSFGSQPAGPSDQGAGFRGANLRGLGIDKTLVLVNGQRLAKHPGFNAPDLDILPLSAIESVEVLLTSGSAIYGSDALAGVIQIRTRQNESLGSIGAQIERTAAGGSEQEHLEAVYGYTGDRWSSLTSFNYTQKGALQQTERSWYDMFTASNGVPTSYQPDGGSFVPLGGEEACPGPIVRRSNGVFCGFDLQPSLYYLIPESNGRLFQDLSYEASTDVTVFLRVFASQLDQDRRGLGAPLRGRQVGVTRVDQLVDEGVLPEDVRGQDLSVQGRFADLPQKSENHRQSLSLLLGSTIDLASGNQLDISVFRSDILQKNDWSQGYFLNDVMNEAIFSGTYDVFAPLGERGDSGAERSLWSKQEAEITGAEAVLKGNWNSSLWAASWEYAVGTAYQEESYEKQCSQELANGEVFALGCGQGAGDRSSAALFAELSLSWDRSQLRLAGRADDHSDFGLAATPMLGYSYNDPSGFFAVLNYSEGFKAPNLSELYDGSARSQTGEIDYLRCRQAREAGASAEELELLCEEPAQFQVVTGGNAELKEENSQSLLLGAGYQPSKDWGLALNYQRIDVSNEIRFPDIETVLLQESQGVTVSGVAIERDPDNASDPNSLVSITSGYLNLSRSEFQGIDAAAFVQGGDRLRWRWDMSVAYVLSFRSELLPGSGFEQLVGQDQRPRWRSTQGLTLDYNNHRLALQLNSLAGYRKNDVTAGSVGDFSTLDGSYRWSLPYGLLLTISGQNLLRSTPPQDTTGGNDRGIDGRLYDPRGTRYAVGLSKTW
ncbi:MAG: TonB-dependent receptor [Pseudobacteriovorax sp.]|nr:TonB-dependent receptor [Pseudobacteriovorax sp.]